jgi:hypothetical protein
MIKWNEASTKRGIVWGITAIIGTYGWMIGKDIQPILLLGAAVASGLGVMLDDNK